MTQTDTEFLKAAGIKPQPRDRWHWLRHRWSQWTEPYEVLMQGALWLDGKQWVESRQARWCLTCRVREQREVRTA